LADENPPCMLKTLKNVLLSYSFVIEWYKLLNTIQTELTFD